MKVDPVRQAAAVRAAYEARNNSPRTSSKSVSKTEPIAKQRKPQGKKPSQDVFTSVLSWALETRESREARKAAEKATPTKSPPIQRPPMKRPAVAAQPQPAVDVAETDNQKRAAAVRTAFMERSRLAANGKGTQGAAKQSGSPFGSFLNPFPKKDRTQKPTADYKWQEGTMLSTNAALVGRAAAEKAKAAMVAMAEVSPAKAAIDGMAAMAEAAAAPSKTRPPPPPSAARREQVTQAVEAGRVAAAKVSEEANKRMAAEAAMRAQQVALEAAEKTLQLAVRAAVTQRSSLSSLQRLDVAIETAAAAGIAQPEVISDARESLDSLVAGASKSIQRLFEDQRKARPLMAATAPPVETTRAAALPAEDRMLSSNAALVGQAAAERAKAAQAATAEVSSSPLEPAVPATAAEAVVDQDTVTEKLERLEASLAGMERDGYPEERLAPLRVLINGLWKEDAVRRAAADSVVAEPMASDAVISVTVTAEAEEAATAEAEAAAAAESAARMEAAAQEAAMQEAAAQAQKAQEAATEIESCQALIMSFLKLPPDRRKQLLRKPKMSTRSLAPSLFAELQTTTPLCGRSNALATALLPPTLLHGRQAAGQVAP